MDERVSCHFHTSKCPIDRKPSNEVIDEFEMAVYSGVNTEREEEAQFNRISPEGILHLGLKGIAGHSGTY